MAGTVRTRMGGTLIQEYAAYWLIFAISFKIVPYLDEFKPFIQMIQQRDAVKDIAWIQAV